MSGSARTMVAYPEDDVEVTWRTSGKWDTAGLVKQANGTWYMVANGFSSESVRKRTIKYYNGHYASAHLVATEVTAIFETTVPVVRDYFGDHRVVIDSYFVPGRGNVYTSPKGIGEGRMSAGRSVVRRLLAEGATQISFRLRGTTKIADFQAPELRKSLRMGKAA